MSKITPDVVSKLKEKIAACSGHEIVFIEEDYKYALFIQKLPEMSPVVQKPTEMPPGVKGTIKIPISMVLDPGQVTFGFAGDGETITHCKDIKRIGIYNYQALNINAVLNKYRSKFKREQTRGPTPGIIFIEFDLSNLNQKERDGYLKLLGAVLTFYFNKGNGKEIGGVGITTPTAITPNPTDIGNPLILKRTSVFVRNPLNPLPPNFPNFTDYIYYL